MKQANLANETSNPDNRPARPGEPARRGRVALAPPRRRRWLSFGASTAEALIVTGAVGLAAIGAASGLGRGVSDKAACLGGRLFDTGKDCGSGTGSLAAAMAGAPMGGGDANSAATAGDTRSTATGGDGDGPATAGNGDRSGSGRDADASRLPAGQGAGVTGAGADRPAAADGEPSVGSAPSNALSEAERTAVSKRLTGEGADAGEPHLGGIVKGVLNLPPHTSDPGLTRDGNNTFLNALMYKDTKDAKYAKQAAAVLAGWAKAKPDFKGSNGWLNAAWYVGEMARAAKMLKDSGAAEKVPGVKQAIASFTDWAKTVAAKEWLPKDAPPFGTDLQKVLNWERPRRPDPPQLGTRWERMNISNRSMVALEATMHVALLAGDKEWFDKGVQAYKYIVKPRTDGTSFFLDADGKNADHSRQDKPTWHHQAGVASAVAIAQMASHVTDPSGKPYDLWSLENNILRNASEKYAGEVIKDRSEKKQVWYIPYYQTVVDHYGEKNVPNTKAVLDSHTSGWDAYMDTGFGFNQFL